jgi:hypothetical protein|eukprot:COSAG03_NODE_1478_length_4016_cov_1.825632_4_plen_132_part_00
MYSALLGDYSWKILDFEPNFRLTRAELIDLCGLCRVVARRAARYWMNMRIATDAVPGLGCCAVRWIDRLLNAGASPAVYSYLFAHPDQETFVPGTAPGGVFVPHAAEILYVFGCDATAGLNTEEAALAAQM